MMPLGTRFAAPVKKIGESRLNQQSSMVQGNIEELNRYISQNEYQLKSKEGELREAKRCIENLEKQLHELASQNKQMEVSIQNEQRVREEIVQRTRKVQQMYGILKEQAAKLTESFRKTEDACSSAVAENAARDSKIQELVEKIAQIEERAYQQKIEFDQNVLSLESQMKEKQLEFEKSFGELSTALDTAEQDRREKSAKIVSLDEDISNLSAEKERLLKERSSLDEEMSNLFAEKERLLKECSSLDEEISNLSAEKEHLLKERSSLKENLAKLTLDKQEVEAKLREQLEKFSILEANHEGLKRQLNEMSEDCEAKKVEIADQAKLLEETRAKVADLELQLGERSNELAAKVEHFMQAESKWTSQMEEALQRESSLLAEKEALTKELNEANLRLEEIPELERKIKELQSLLSSLQTELGEKCENFGMEMESKKAEIVCLNERFQEELRSKEDELKAVSELTFSFAQKIDLLEGDIAMLRGNSEKAKLEICEHESKIGELNATIEERDGKIFALRADLAKAVEKNGELLSEKDELLKSVDGKQQSIASLKSEKESLFAEMAAKEREISVQNEKIEKLSAKIEDLTASIESSKLSMKGGEEKWQVEKTNLLEQLKKAEETREEFTRENDALQRAISNEQQKVEALQSEKFDADKARKAAELELSQKVEEIAKSEQKVKAIRSEMSHLEGEFGQKLKQERERVAQLEAEVAEKKREVNQALDDIRQKSTILNEAEQKSAKLERELEKLRVENSPQTPAKKPAERSYAKAYPAPDLAREGPQQDARRSPRVARKVLAERPNPLITVTDTSTNPEVLEVLTQKSPVIASRRHQAPVQKAIPARPQPTPQPAQKTKAHALAKSTPSLQFDLDSNHAEDVEETNRGGDDDSADETWQPSAQKKSRKSAPPVLQPPVSASKVSTPAPKAKKVEFQKTPVTKPAFAIPPPVLKPPKTDEKLQNQVGPVRKMSSGAPKRIYLDPVSGPGKNSLKPAPQQQKAKQAEKEEDPFAFLDF